MIKSDPRAIAKIIAGQWPAIVANCNSHQIRMLQAIKNCRTEVMGGHLYACDHCGVKHYRYNSCRNRHCNQCQHTQKQHWIKAREDQLLPCAYYHLVFTLPEQLNRYCLFAPQQMYSMLFRTAWETLNEFGWNPKYLGGQVGATMVLHTWGSTMSFHPHLHCIVPAGGVGLRNEWRVAKGNGKFLFPVKALAKVFRGKYMESFKKWTAQSEIEVDGSLIDKLYRLNWVVYAKPTFGGAKTVIKYLARYTHNIAISHHRIKSFNDEAVNFLYTDYRQKNKKKTMRLSASEFVRRFAMHILPRGFRRIRHYGILSSVWKKRLFPEIPVTQKTDWQSLWEEKGLDVQVCRRCKVGNLIMLAVLLPVRGPPRPKSFIDYENHKHKKAEIKR